MKVTNDLRQHLQELLKPYHQTHLLRFWDDLSDSQRQQLAAQVSSIDFQLLGGLHAGQVTEDWTSLASRAVAPPAFRLGDRHQEIGRDAARERGEVALRAGQVAAVLVAGGQGTRLGFPHPKGMFPIGPVSHRTLFQMHIDRLQAIGSRHGVEIPLLLMTSPATDSATREYFAQHADFGMGSDQLFFFQQGTMPSVDQDTGQVLLAARDQVSLSPDGHGGMLAALDRAGLIDMARQRGIEYLFYFQVDNPLVTLVDPEFLGFHILTQSEMSSQVIAKKDPLEKVGNVVSVEGKLRIIEYSDLPDELAAATDADGEPIFWAGSIAVHVFDVNFLQRAAQSSSWLPFHTAHKKVPFLAENGELVEPNKPNAIKFERFIFDLLPHAQNAIVVEVDERKAFAPVKNASGSPKDSPESTRHAITAFYREWLRQAGAELNDRIAVEIHPQFALDVHELSQRLPSEAVFNEDTYLR